MPIIIGAGGGAKLVVFFFQCWVIVTQGHQRRRADRHRVGAKCEGLRHIGAIADASRNDQLHLAMHAKILQRLHRRPNTGQGRLADMFDEDFLGRRRAALHSVQDHDIGAGLDA